jgi:NitT/TauT family transport system ATP-binding protein
VPAGGGRPKVQLSEVSVAFSGHGGPVLALDRISLDVAAGEFLCLVGPSGCGKSTLLRVCAGLVRQSAGEVAIHAEHPGTPLTAMVFQEHALLPWRTVLDNVLLPVEMLRRRRADYEGRAHALLAMAGLDDFAATLPHELSGGMKQRVAICRALVHDPALLLMDEPFSALDAMTRDQMGLELLRIWEVHKKTVVFVTHSIREAVFLSDRVLVMTPRPATIGFETDVKLPRPRTMDMQESDEFNRYVGLLRHAIEAGAAP